MAGRASDTKRPLDCRFGVYFNLTSGRRPNRVRIGSISDFLTGDRPTSQSST